MLYSLDEEINPSINSIIKHATAQAKKGKKFIKKATRKGKGKLHDFAEEHRLLNKDGNIDLRKTKRFVKRNLKGKARKVREKEVQLAETLQGLRG
jgi:hypothetical protein